MDTCKLAPHLCAARIKSAVRASMPQLDSRSLLRWAKRGRMPNWVVDRANKRRLTRAEVRILTEMDAVSRSRIRDPVRVSLLCAPLSLLSVTQREARHSTVEALARRVARGESITKDDPIVICFASRGVGYKVIDGHHRFLAHALAATRSRGAAPKSVHAFLIHLPHPDAMRVSWAASVGHHRL